MHGSWGWLTEGPTHNSPSIPRVPQATQVQSLTVLLPGMEVPDIKVTGRGLLWCPASKLELTVPTVSTQGLRALARELQPLVTSIGFRPVSYPSPALMPGSLGGF